MRILFVASLYSPYIGGGAELVLQNQAESLAERGHAVHVLTLGEPGSGVVREHGAGGVEVLRVGIANSYFPGTARASPIGRLAWHARDVFNPRMADVAHAQACALQPDVIVCHNLPGWSAAVWPALAKLEAPVVQVLHDQYVRCIRSNMFKGDRACGTPCLSCRLMRLPHRPLSRQLDAVVGVSRYVLDSVTEAGYFEDVPIRTYIRNVSHLDTRTRPTPALTAPEVVFGYIGGMTASKGVEVLLEAFVAGARPHWRLRVAGVGPEPYVTHLQTRFADPRIEFLGRAEPGSFYSSIDVTVVPSLWNDTLPSVVFESLIHGRPVIGSRRGGIPEMIEDGSSGMLFDPIVPLSLQTALQDFASDLTAWRSRANDIKADATPEYCDRASWSARWEQLFEDASRARQGARS